MVLKVKKQKFHGNDSPISINDIDINKIVVSNKLPFRKQGFINFIGQKDDKKNQTFMHILSKRECIQNR